MLRFFAFAMMLCLVSLTWAATTKKKAPAKQTSSTAAGRATKTASAQKGTKKAAAKKTTWRNRQKAPSPQRYRQIQESLVAKGYLRPEDATGAWSQTSIDGLKRFQADQNIESTGKINSLSLIALGLGPKRDPVVMPPAPNPGDQ